MRLFAGALAAGILLVVDFLLYQSSGASDCGECSVGQVLVAWGLIVLPVAILGLLGAATAKKLRHR